jgi:hypothetical protein
VHNHPNEYGIQSVILRERLSVLALSEPRTLKLAEEVLALHEGIREVFILEERSGRFMATDRAVRDGDKLLSGNIDLAGSNATLALAVIVGAATQLAGESGPARLVGIMYDKGGVFFCHLDENRVLALSTSPESLYNVMQTLKDSLPGLIGAATERVVKSAPDAEKTARYYLANRTGGSPRVMIDGVSYQGATRRWEIHGSYRPIAGIRSKHFQLEVDADDGSVMEFDSSNSSSWSITIVVGLASMFAAICLLAWLIYYAILR